MSREAYIYDVIRTPIGRHAGKLAAIRPDDLAAMVLKALVERNPFPPEAYEDVVLGCANQAGEDSRNVARHAGLLAGLPVEVAGQTINRLCSSGLAAVITAAHAVRCGEGDLFLAGGVESMSRAPFAMNKAESAYGRDVKMFDTALGARFPNPCFVAGFGNDSLAETADNIAREVGISRSESDAFAFASQSRYAQAKQAGFYQDELLPVPVPSHRGPPTVVADDEHPRPETTVEGLAKLRPLFDGGVTTAGSASGINDGAAGLVIGSIDAGEKFGAKPRARIVASAVTGVPPRIMGMGPVLATKKCMERTALSLQDMDVMEINEAFAPQVLGCLKQMQIAYDDPRLNPNGGAIAIGHPLGASGARLALTAVRQLERQSGRYALVTLCIGVGQGMAAILERV
ncbi:MAG: 3-oxoadipyl-CoA thiolase [Terriglobales bacterium]